MINKNKHINEEKFKSYLENRMTNKERNAFEKKLQKNPFEAEALEGFELGSAKNIQKDLKELKEKIHPQKQKNVKRYWAAAATFLLLVSTSLIWVQLNNQAPVRELTEAKPIENKSTTAEKQPKITEPNENKTLEDEGNNVVENLNPEPEKENISTQKAIVTNNDSEKIESADILTDEAEISETIFLETEPQTETLQEKNSSLRGVSSEIDSNFAVTVAGIEKQKNTETISTTNFAYKVNEISEIQAQNKSEAAEKLQEFQFVANENNQNQVQPSATAPREKSGNRIFAEDSKATPVLGIIEFENYIDSSAILSTNFKRNKATVKLIIEINELGETTRFQNLNKTDSLLFEHTKQIILNGPKWNPEIKNGVAISSEIELKIVFRKK